MYLIKDNTYFYYILTELKTKGQVIQMVKCCFEY